MTREEILNMPAGREMDALVGEYVFGWEKGTFPVYEPMKSKHGDYMVRPIAKYSIDIEAAWEVVEKLDSAFSLARAWKLKEPEWKGFSFWVGDGSSALAETAPLAICRAALLAVMELEK